MTVLNVPLKPAQAQRVTVQLDGTTYRLRLTWCAPAACWMTDFYDEDDVLLLGGVPLVTGANLLGQYEYLGIPGALFVQTDHAPDTPPTFANLGEAGHLYYVPPA